MAPPQSFESVFAIDAQDGGPGIPERPRDITPDLISRAFASSHPGAEAAAVTVVDAHSGTTGRARLRVEWKHPAGAPAAVFAKLGDEMPPAFHEMARIYMEHTEAFCDRLDEGRPTLIHGDSHLGNLLLDGGRIGFLDWACTAKAPGMRDVSYFLSNSISAELRRAEERSLLAVYLEGLERAGGTAPSFEQAWLQYRLYAACGWIAATVTAAAGSRMQALEIGMRSMKRSTDAIVELETPELFRQELGLS